MTATMRPPPEVRINNRARLLAAEVERHDRRAAHHTSLAAAVRAEIDELWVEACERFDLDLPKDPILLDVVDSIEVASANRWIWLGARNNKNLATFRFYDETGPHEMSVVRFLAVRLGVIGEDDHGALYPVEGDTEDINPFHRDFRPSPKRNGNPVRFNGSDDA